MWSITGRKGRTTFTASLDGNQYTVEPFWSLMLEASINASVRQPLQPTPTSAVVLGTNDRTAGEPFYWTVFFAFDQIESTKGAPKVGRVLSSRVY